MTTNQSVEVTKTSSRTSSKRLTGDLPRIQEPFSHTPHQARAYQCIRGPAGQRATMLPTLGGTTSQATAGTDLTGMHRCLKAVIRTLTCTHRAPMSPPIAPMAQKIGTSQT